MKCPNCGMEIEDGKLLCPACGHEIQMVPVYEPELEEDLTQSMRGIRKEIRRHEKRRIETEKEFHRGMEDHLHRFHVYGYIAIVAIVIVFAIWIYVSAQSNDINYQLEQAKKCAETEDYKGAIEYTLRAVELENTNLNARLLLGEYYDLDGNEKNAITAFEDIIHMDNDNEQAYEGLIAIYDRRKDYKKINELILSSTSTKIQNQFVKYLASPPSFSEKQGSYTEILPIKITANTTGTIYYTLDGSTPDQSSAIYSTPIFLEDGLYTLKAVFINDYGITSRVSASTYEIYLSKAHEPQVFPDSGSYEAPQMITVKPALGEKVYYTTDGTDPDSHSVEYTNPIVMPLSASTYKFVSYNPDGVASEIVTRKYMFTYISTVDLPTANHLLMNGLIERGLLLDGNGQVAGKSGHNIYICSTVIAINGRNYYLFVEYYEDQLGNDTTTGNLYCIDAETGELNKAAIDGIGRYSVISM